MKNKNVLALIVVILVLVVAGIIILKSPNKKEKKTEKVETEQSVDEEIKDEEIKDEDSQEPDQEEVAEQEETEGVSVRTTANVNLREEADGNSAIIVLLPSGTVLKKTGEENGWVHVEVNGKVGYVSAQYIVDADAVVEEPDSTTSKVEAIPGQYRDANNVIVCIKSNQRSSFVVLNESFNNSLIGVLFSRVS